MVSACKGSLSIARSIRLKSSSKPVILQINEIRYIHNLEQLVEGYNSWLIQKAWIFRGINKAEWSKKTDWNMAENHGNRLLSKQFMEAQ